MTAPLSGRVAAVTGGSGGIGAAVARMLAEAGADVVVGSRRADTACAACAGVHAHGLDVRDPVSVAAFFDAIRARHGAVHILVVAAGCCRSMGFEALSEADWEDEIAINLSGTYRCIRAVLPGMTAQGWGRIVSVASDIALLGSADYPAYAAAKAGVVSLTRSAALAGARHNVSANTISPGWVDTAMAREALAGMAGLEGTDPQSLLSALTRVMPRNRLVEPEEIASLVLHLCSDAAGAITMQDIAVDGGARWYLDRLEVAQ